MKFSIKSRLKIVWFVFSSHKSPNTVPIPNIPNMTRVLLRVQTPWLGLWTQIHSGACLAPLRWGGEEMRRCGEEHMCSISPSEHNEASPASVSVACTQHPSQRCRGMSVKEILPFLQMKVTDVLRKQSLSEPWPIVTMTAPLFNSET